MQYLEATKDHARGIAEVHVQSWQEAYAGIVPDDLLANLSVAKRTESWTTIICSKQRPQFTVVALDNGRVVGFSNGGVPQNRALGYECELSALYLIQSHQKRGVGRELFHRLLTLMARLEPRDMYLWVLSDCATVGFYRHLGGEYKKTETIVLGGKSLNKDLYVWSFR